MKLWMKILIALVLGFCCGLVLGPQAQYLKPIGTAFLSLLNMIIPLLILSSMTLGITSIQDPKKLGRIGIKSLVTYLITTLIAIIIGLGMADLLAPGLGVGLMPINSASAVKQNPTDILQLFLALIPHNPIGALAQGNVLQIIVFAVFLGVSINFAGEKGKPVLHFFESLANVMYRMTSIIMEFSPVGVFAIMAWVAGSFGFAVIVPLLKFLSSFYLACLIHVVFIFCGMLWFMVKVKPWPFFKGMGDAIMMGFSTCSSSATLPVALHCTQENLGVSKNVANFVLPLGTTLNMNGTAIFQVMAALFIAQAYGIVLDWQSILTIVVASTFSALGAAGIPGSGFIMLSAVVSSAGLPIEGLAILAGIDRLREMVATVLNVMGDAVCAMYIAKKEGELDERQYYSSEIIRYREVREGDS